MSRNVTFKGNPLTLVGEEVQVGQAAPQCELTNGSLESVSLADLQGKPTLISVVPSLDTPVCHAETKKFNEQVDQLTNTEVLVVSTDLPFGQKRWCGAEGVEKVTTLSAHRSTAFGESFGVLISGGPLDRCLARAIFAVDETGTLTHVEYVGEIAEHPDYDAVLAAVGV